MVHGLRFFYIFVFNNKKSTKLIIKHLNGHALATERDIL